MTITASLFLITFSSTLYCGILLDTFIGASNTRVISGAGSASSVFCLLLHLIPFFGSNKSRNPESAGAVSIPQTMFIYFYIQGV